MPTTKLTLSIRPGSNRQGSANFQASKTSVSAMFARYISTLEDSDYKRSSLPPMTKRAHRPWPWSS